LSWPREGIEDKVARDAAQAAAGTSLIKMIVPGGAAPGVVAGSVVMWQHDEGEGAWLSETGWMVLPEFQGQGVGKRAVRMLLELAGQQNHWGPGACLPRDHQRPLQRHLPLPRLHVRRRVRHHLRRPRLALQRLVHRPPLARAGITPPVRDSP
jgi:GNAT superfamily N-acetyltransferase